MKYGTSGFRDYYKKIVSISYKIGEILAWFAISNNEDFGVMITASHNHYLDNGLKIINSDGNMINKNYEIILEKYVNNNFEIPKNKTFSNAKIYIGHDTRNSYFEIKNEIVNGIKSISDIKIIDFGIVTTPQHHFLTKYGLENPNFYINKYNCLFNFDFNFDNLIIDCANGVGFITLSKLNESYNLNLKLVNTNIDKSNLLNNESGSDYVINNKKLPHDNKYNKYLGCSIDGDADRFIFYYYDEYLKILDGDYLALLYILAVNKYIPKNFTIGYIHTPYTNKSVIDYLSNLKIDIICTATGVKNLHEEALKYDVGIYFESNGHGTILINDKKLLSETFFKNISLLNNEVVGDGISGIFCVRYFLNCLNMSYNDWFNIIKKNDFILYKKEVKNKDIFKTNEIGNRLLEPKNIQIELDNLMDLYKCFCFIRPSGTENIIRIYIESNFNLDILKLEIDNLINKIIF